MEMRCMKGYIHIPETRTGYIGEVCRYDVMVGDKQYTVGFLDKDNQENREIARRMITAEIVNDGLTVKDSAPAIIPEAGRDPSVKFEIVEASHAL